MTLALAPGFDFAVEQCKCFVRRSADARVVAAIDPIEASLVSLGSEDAVRELLGLRGLLALEKLRGRFGRLIEDREGAVAPELAPSGLRPHGTTRTRWRPGPRVLHWTVTHVCPRRCAYCFAEPKHGSTAADSTLARTRLSELMAESYSLGTEGILLSGSEPLLRDDLPEIIGDANRIGLDVVLTTKHPISRDLASRLARAGLSSLALSVDTLDADLSHELIGSRAYPQQVVRSVANLAEQGLGFSIQAVLTPKTARTMKGLLTFARTAGALAVQLVPFERVRRPITAIDQGSLEVAGADVDALMKDLRAGFPELKLTLFEKGQDDSCAGSHCDIGHTKLFFTPAGRVHRCYKLTDDSALLGPDLTKVGIAEAWHDQGFGASLLPATKDYEGSACVSCGSFGACHQSGRCIFEAKEAFGRYAAPDRACENAKHATASPISSVVSHG